MGIRQVALLGAVIAVLSGCAGSGGAIPVVDSGRPVSNEDMRTGAGRVGTSTPQAPATQQDSGVVVMVPDGQGGLVLNLSFGIGVVDIAAAKLAYDLARERGVGLEVDM